MASTNVLAPMATAMDMQSRHPRAEWIARRKARKPRRQFLADALCPPGRDHGRDVLHRRKEKTPPELVRDEVAADAMIILREHQPSGTRANGEWPWPRYARSMPTSQFGGHVEH